jgi:hypothetical protein
MTIARPKLHATLASRFILLLLWACCSTTIALAAGCGLGGSDPALTPPDASPGDGSTAPDTSGDSATTAPDSGVTTPDSAMTSPDSATGGDGGFDTGTCVPNCEGQVCGGSDGCMGVCASGSCGTGLHCVTGVCECDATSCSGCCGGGVCTSGTDPSACGTGGATCVACSLGYSCSAGSCVCVPDCTGAVCGGSDGCGGTCLTGSCGVGQTCASGVCICDSASCPTGCCSAQEQCLAGDLDTACGTDGAACGVCLSTETCVSGQCVTSTGCNSPEVSCGNACCNVYGNSTSLGGTGTYDAGAICVRPVTITAAGTLEDIGIIGSSAGVDFVMGLYTNTTTGTPGDLVAQTAETLTTSGTLVLPTPATSVAAGSYWIAASFNGTDTVVESATATVTAYCATVVFSATLPAVFPASTAYTGREASWYVLVE